MDMSQVAMCGDYCPECAWREQVGCAGCQQAAGEMFWGTCRIAVCCSGKGFLHCGECPDLPCDILQEGFDHPEHGDRGERLANLKAWAEGRTRFIKIGTFSETKE